MIALVDVAVAILSAAAFGAFSPGTLSCLVTFFALTGMNGTYRRPRVALSALGDMKATVITASTPLLLAGTATAFGIATEPTVRFAAALVPAVAVGRVLSYRVIKVLRARGHLLQPAVVVGSGRLNQRLIQSFEAKDELGLRIIGYVEATEQADDVAAPWLGSIDDLDAILRTNQVRRLVVGFSERPDHHLARVLRDIQTRPLEVFVIPRLYEWGSASGDMRTQDCAGTPIVWLPHREWRWEQLALKRASDLAMAGGIMLLGGPVYILCALAVKLTSPGPVFFRQKRVGKDGVVFEMLKFRSMRHDPLAVHTQGGGGDPRITKVGAFLRRTSLDEIPQMINVLKGDMSMVGPRPEQVTYAAQCGEQIPGYADRHRVRVGVTGWAQINQLRGVGTSLEERARYDNYYIEHWSMWRDLAIVVRTAAAAARGS